MNGQNSNTSGEQVVSLTFAPKTDKDLLSDKVMEEIVRRLIATLESLAQGNTVFSPTAPEDKTKAWWRTNPITNFPEGQPMVWNPDSDSWVPVLENSYPAQPKRRLGLFTDSPAGASTQNVPFTDIGTTNYMVILTPTTWNGSVWLPAHLTFPTHFGYEVIEKTPTLLAISFFGVPTGGIRWEIDIIERLP